LIKKLTTLFRGEMWLLWIVAGFFLQAMLHTTENTLISLALLTGYAFCIFMFMLKLRGRQSDRMKDIELMSMDFIRECRKTGRGQFNYLVPYTPEERTKRWYAKLFNRHYLRIYEATFWDEGTSGFKAHKIVSVSNKQAFEMKLRGWINTESNERATEALDYLGVEWPIP